MFGDPLESSSHVRSGCRIQAQQCYSAAPYRLVGIGLRRARQRLANLRRKGMAEAGGLDGGVADLGIAVLNDRPGQQCVDRSTRREAQRTRGRRA